MKIGKSEYYAIILINSLKEPGLHRLSEISSKYEIPEDFLYKVALKLKKTGLISSKEGINGGYTLEKPFLEITLFDVLEAFKAEDKKDCLCDDTCSKKEYCQKYGRIKNDINNKLKEINLSDI